MRIQVWNYIKKLNSTARPDSATPLAEYNIVLKEKTSFNNPIFILNLEGSLPAFNYIKWVDLNQYYKVSDVVSMNNKIFEVHCEIDALATARPYIKNTSTFVKYISDTNFINSNLRDDRIIPTTDIEVLVSRNNFSDLVRYGNDATYCWCLTTFSETDGLCSYLISTNQVRYLTQKLTEDGTSVWGSIQQLFGDVKGSIISCTYIPFKLESLQDLQQNVADSPTRIYLGDYDTEVDGYKFYNYCREISDVIQIPSGTYRDFRISSPYQEAKLYVPLLGTLEISLDDFEDKSFIGFKYVVNLTNGNISFSLKHGDEIISTHGGNCSLSMPLAYQQLANGLNTIIGAASLVAGVASGGALTIAGIAGGVASFASTFKKTTTTMGAFGGNFSANMDNYMRLSIFKHGISDTPDNIKSLYGSPAGKVVNLSQVSEGSYIQTLQFSLAAPFDEVILSKVNNLMDSGVYLE